MPVIEKIKAGRGFDAARVGLIMAPQDAPAGSMAELTQFFEEQTDIKALPGYYGPQRNHVLRLSGLPETNAEFLRLLHEDFPAWQEKRHPGETTIQIAPGIECDAMDDVDHFPYQPGWKKFVKENANTLTGLAYMAGSVGLLLAAWRKPRRMPNKPDHDWFRSYTAGAYFTAAGILVAMSQQQDRPRHVYDILEKIYPPLNHATPEQLQDIDQTQNGVLDFLKKYPWETSMILNASGAGAHAISCAKRGDFMELAGAVGTMTGCMLSSVIPEKGGRSLIPIGEWLEDEHGHSLYERIEDFAAHHPHLGSWMLSVNRAYDWLEDNPLRAASGTSFASNLAYASAGLRAQNMGLAGMSGAFMVGNYTQSQATKGRGDSFDSVVTAAASIIAADPQVDKQDKRSVRRRVKQLAHRLQAQQEIVHNESKMERGILARLERELNPTHDVLDGFLPSETHYISQSPFVDASHVSRLLQSDSASNATGIG